MGVGVGKNISRKYTEQFKTPTILAVNQLDREDADFDRTLREARPHFGSNVVAVQYPFNAGNTFKELNEMMEDYIDDFVFDDDKLLTPANKKRIAG